MAKNIVKELREFQTVDIFTRILMDDAADEIERLERIIHGWPESFVREEV